MNLVSMLVISIFIALSIVFQTAAAGIDSTIKYRSSVGNCPSRVVGDLTIGFLKEFDREHSLKYLKEKILRESIVQKYFLSDYKIDYNPVTKVLTFMYECPRPLMKVQVYKENKSDSYTAILVENGKLYDSSYEYLLRQDKKLMYELPFLAMPISDINNNRQMAITDLFNTMDMEFKKKISEFILNENNELTVILSIKGKASSAFLGQDNWVEKFNKLQKIIDYMQTQSKVPSVINLSNGKKIVVKFPDKP